MLVKWKTGKYSVVLRNKNGEITVWHPCNSVFAVFSYIYNPTEAEIRQRYNYSIDYPEELEELINVALLNVMVNDFEVARDTN